MNLNTILCLNQNDKLTRKSDIIYFENLHHNSRTITHLGDNLIGKGDRGDEEILVNLPQFPDTISNLFFVFNIFNCIKLKQNFEQVENTFVRLVNFFLNQLIARYNLFRCEYQGNPEIILSEVYCHNTECEITAVREIINIKNISRIVNEFQKNTEY
ncbi:MAG: TerD family protein [cyanobacterium endosymbiont of Rhopalodia yunnanensis]